MASIAKKKASSQFIDFGGGTFDISILKPA